MFKTIGLLIAAFLIQSASAATLSDRAYDISEALKNVERNMDREDKRDLRHHILQIEDILSFYDTGAPQTELMCSKVSDWSSGKNYKLMRTADRTYVGTSATTLTKCKQLINNSTKSHICAAYSDWSSGKNYKVTHISTLETYGTHNMTETNCTATIPVKRATLMCAKFSDWSSGKNFHLIDIKTKEKYNTSGTSLAECLKMF